MFLNSAVMTTLKLVAILIAILIIAFPYGKFQTKHPFIHFLAEQKFFKFMIAVGGLVFVYGYFIENLFQGEVDLRTDWWSLPLVLIFIVAYIAIIAYEYKRFKKNKTEY